jgi:hypothetical protein
MTASPRLRISRDATLPSWSYDRIELKGLPRTNSQMTGVTTYQFQEAGHTSRTSHTRSTSGSMSSSTLLGLSENIIGPQKGQGYKWRHFLAIVDISIYVGCGRSL